MEAPEYYYVHEPTEKVVSGAGEHFSVDDLLDLSNEDDTSADHGDFLDNAAANSADSYTITTPAAVESCNSSISGDNAGSSYCQAHRDNGGFYGSFNLSGELCVPYDDVAELEWLSNFVEDSFSAKQPSLSLDFLPAASQSKAQIHDPSTTSRCPQLHIDSSSAFLPEHSPLRSKSRSKRPRAVTCDWTTRLLHLTVDNEAPPRTSSSKRDGNGGTDMGTDAAPRRCLHCAAEKTPQWRTGPMGPKTLCNACGVRYKSGRLVSEYRPAASPTFVSAKHSNSHRKVLELRRQKDMQRVHPHLHPHHHSQFVGSSPTFGSGDPECLIEGPGFRHVI